MHRFITTCDLWYKYQTGYDGVLRYEALEDSVQHDKDVSMHAASQLAEMLERDSAHADATRTVLRESDRVGRLPCTIFDHVHRRTHMGTRTRAHAHTR